MSEMRIVLFGAGGYGDVYVQSLLKDRRRENYVLAGVVDPYIDRAPGREALRQAGVPVFDTPEAFYREHAADLAVIATPIPLHEEQACFALEQGSHVLLEKPIAATAEAGRRIAQKARECGRVLAVGFQWCYDRAMLELKADFDAGRLGAPLDVRALVLWPRDFAYYGRGTGWAGKKRDAQGREIYDSVASNATAHYLENMLWLTGREFQEAAIAEFECETWRANDIETYDTAVLLAQLDNGAKLTYVVSHAVEPAKMQNPVFEYRFEKGVARFGGLGQTGSELTFTFEDDKVKRYGVTHPDSREKIWTMMDVLREGAKLPCPAEAALRHADAIEKMRERQPEAYVFRNIARNSERVWVPGLGAKLIRCYRERMLLSQAGEERA